MRNSGWIVVLLVLLAACGGAAEDSPTTSTTLTADEPEQTFAPVDTTEPQPEETPAPDLTANGWMVALYDIGGAMTNPWPGTELTFAFLDDGTITGFAGCNDFSASYATEGPYNPFEEGVADSEDGQSITISDVSVGADVCEKENTMIQEDEFLAALESSVWWKIRREASLIFSGSDGFFRMESNPTD